jgi:hypothetical protein
MQEKEIIIIGAGISGLYAAYKLKTLHPKSNITILEQNWIGGRMGSQLFEGTDVVTGAGVGRKRKDKLLIKLLNELEIPYGEFVSKHYYAKTLGGKSCNVKETFMKLRKSYTPCKKTFKAYAESILGTEKYKTFVTCSGYTDYEQEDAYDVLYHYGFNDNYDNWTALSIPWTKLLLSLIHKINMRNIHLRSCVEKIEKDSDNNFFVYTNKHVYTCNMIIIATAIDSIRRLLPRENIYRGIKGQTFLRLYGKFSHCSIPIIKEYVKGYTIVPPPLQKIIPMDPDNGIYMIAYNDNKSSKYMKKWLENTETNRSKICTLIKKALGIPVETNIYLSSMLEFYWNIGTHYYRPLDVRKYKNRTNFIEVAQHPMENVLVVGESVSTNQGWVEGALESVESVINCKSL